MRVIEAVELARVIDSLPRLQEGSKRVFENRQVRASRLVMVVIMEVDHGFVVVGSGFVVARAAAVLVDPLETSLDHPNAGPDVETSGAQGGV